GAAWCGRAHARRAHRDRRSPVPPGPAVSAARDALTIRPLESAADLHACVALQDETWGPGFSERVPYAVLWFTRRIGGILIGAFDGDALIGFVFGITGWRDGRPLHWSDMLAVRATTRDRGIGIRLKQA